MIRDTSKNDYQTVMRDFVMYAQGHTLELYFRDYAMDYKWMTKAQFQYGKLEKRLGSATEKQTM